MTGAEKRFLSLRLDPQVFFILNLIAKVRGQTKTMVVQRAIHGAAISLAQEEKVDWKKEWEAKTGRPG